MLLSRKLSKRAIRFLSQASVLSRFVREAKRPASILRQRLRWFALHVRLPLSRLADVSRKLLISNKTKGAAKALSP